MSTRETCILLCFIVAVVLAAVAAFVPAVRSLLGCLALAAIALGLAIGAAR